MPPKINEGQKRALRYHVSAEREGDTEFSTVYSTCIYMSANVGLTVIT